MKFLELPETIRVKLDEEGQDKFWKQVEKQGVKQFSNQNGISKSNVYNWRSKNSFLPVKIVSNILNSPEHITAYKSGGRSRPVEKPVFPIPEDKELLTRVKYSVNVSEKGIPVYQTSKNELIQRFQELLEKLGEVPVKIYGREVYELRYPKYLHTIFEKMDFEEDLDAKIDEIGEIEDEISLKGKSVEPGKIGSLYDRDKRMKLALIKQDRKEIAKLMKEEREKVRNVLEEP